MKKIVKTLVILLIGSGAQQVIAQTDTALKKQVKPLQDTPKQKILIQDSVGKTVPMPNSPMRNSNTEPMPVKPVPPTQPTQPTNPVLPNTTPPKK